MRYLLSRIKQISGLNLLSGGKVLRPDEDILVQKGNRLHELILLLVLVYSVVFTILNYSLFNITQGIITAIPVIVVPVEYFLYRKGYPLISKTLNMVLVTTVIGMLSLVTTPETGVLAFFIPCFLGSLITFQGREQPYAYFLTFLGFLYLIFFLVTDIRIEAEKPLTPDQLQTEWLMNFGGASVATIFQVVFVLLVSNKLQQNLINASDELQKKNTVLSEALHTNIEQNKQISSQLSQIRKSELELAKLSLIAKKTKNGVIISDKFGQVEWVNDAFTETSGYTLAEVIGKKPKDFLRIPGQKDEAFDLLADRLSRKEFIETTIVNYRKDGSEYYNQLEIIPVFKDNGEHTNFIAIQRDITKQRQLEKMIIDQKLNEQKLITEITIQSQEKEKSELGAELHDNINQILAAAKMYLDLYAAKLPAPDAAIEKSHYNIDLALQEIRKLSHSLVTPTLGKRDLFEAIKDLVSDLTQAAGITIIYNNDLPEGTEISDTRKLVLYRIVQEHFNNILKYAKATEVSVKLRKSDNKVHLTLVDNGVGFDLEKKARGIGFKNISNRVQLYSGGMTVETSPGRGCTLDVYIQLN